jgi:hypothetical protein
VRAQQLSNHYPFPVVKEFSLVESPTLFALPILRLVVVVLFVYHRHRPHAPPSPTPHTTVLEALKTTLEAAQKDARVKAIVLTGSKGKFSGGFDITQLKARSEG